MGRMTGQTEVQSRKDLKTTLAQFVNDLGKCMKKNTTFKPLFSVQKLAQHSHRNQTKNKNINELIHDAKCLLNL